jgi:hypothetical protein
MGCMDIRYIIVRRMNHLDMKANTLATMAKLSTRSAYDYVAGEAELRSDALNRVLDVLDLCILPRSDVATKLPPRYLEHCPKQIAATYSPTLPYWLGGEPTDEDMKRIRAKAKRERE